MMTLKPDFTTTGSWKRKYWSKFQFQNQGNKMKMVIKEVVERLVWNSNQINLEKIFDTSFDLLQKGIVLLIEFSSKKKCT